MKNLWLSFYSLSPSIIIFANIINLLSHFCNTEKYGNRKDKPIKNSISGKRQDWEMAGWTIGKERSYCFSVVLQYEPTLIGNADENSRHIECECEKID
mgnify:CR=1 FL=1